MAMTYDALGRLIEAHFSWGYQQFVYAPSGAKVAVMNGQALDHAYVRLPGGSEAIFTSSGLNQYRHADWLGSARLGSSTTGAAVQASAYAPYGEAYQTWGGGLSFTGQNQDTVWNGTAALYDFPARRYSPTQQPVVTVHSRLTRLHGTRSGRGFRTSLVSRIADFTTGCPGRWISPDPAGLAAVGPNDPQTWNRYAYVRNAPLSAVDPDGLFRWADIFTDLGNLFSDPWGAISGLWSNSAPDASELEAPYHFSILVNQASGDNSVGSGAQGLPIILPNTDNFPTSVGRALAAVGSKVQTAACSHVPDVIQAGVGLDAAAGVGLGTQLGLDLNLRSGDLSEIGTASLNKGIMLPDFYGFAGIVRDAPTNASLAGTSANVALGGARMGASFDPQMNNIQFTIGPSLSPYTAATQHSYTSVIWTIDTPFGLCMQ